MTDADHIPARYTSPDLRNVGNKPADRPIASVPPAAYTAAVRHSARVRRLKRLIPLAALASIVVVTLFSIMAPLQSIGGLTLGPVSLSGTKITMDAPKLSGYREGTQPYEVTAASASQDVKNPSIVELNEITGHVQLNGGGRAQITAQTGIYDSQSEFMKLKGNVRVQTDSGYDAQLSSASVDFKGGRVTSEEPVVVKITEGTISANRLDISDNGKHIVFEGKVHTVLDGKKQPAPEKDKR